MRPLWLSWAVCCLGVGLLFAPLVMWTKSAGLYAAATLTGIALIVFSVILPNMKDHAGPATARGWSYNPSSWMHRLPIVVIGFVGFLVARMMSSYQLGHVDTIFEPFFGEGTKQVLTSEVAKAFPISDAGLGAVAYLLESLSGLIGDTRRWRTMPWMVFLFFVLVVPAGVVSIVLIMLQPIVVGAWCTLCLITAVLTLITLPPAVDEMFASAQFLIEERRRGQSVWRLFWLGDGSPLETRTVKRGHSWYRSLAEATKGIDFTWALFLSTVLGVLTVVGYKDYVVGTLVVTIAVLATAEPVRSLRFFNIACALWIFLSGHLAVGLLLAALSLPKGKIEDRYGMWDKYIV